MIILLFTFYCEILQTKHKSSIVKTNKKQIQQINVFNYIINYRQATETLFTTLINLCNKKETYITIVNSNNETS